MTPTETNTLIDEMLERNYRDAGHISTLQSRVEEQASIIKALKEQIKIDELLLSIREVD